MSFCSSVLLYVCDNITSVSDINVCFPLPVRPITDNQVTAVVYRWPHKHFQPITERVQYTERLVRFSYRGYYNHDGNIGDYSHALVLELSCVWFTIQHCIDICFGSVYKTWLIYTTYASHGSCILIWHKPYVVALHTHVLLSDKG